MSTDRESIIAGPGRITYKGQHAFFKNDLVETPKVSTFQVQTSGRQPQERLDNVQYEISGIPNGVYAPVAAWINDYATMRVGQNIFGPDYPLVIESSDGQTYTYKAAALTGVPTLNLSAGKTFWENLTFTTIGANSAAPTTADHYLAIAAAAYPADDGYDPEAIVTQPYALSWGADAPWLNLETEAGVAVAFALSTTPVPGDTTGMLGMRFGSLKVTAKAKPLGVSSAAVLAAMKIQGAGAGRGTSMASRGKLLAVTGSGIYVSLNAAGISAASNVFSGQNNRVGDITWTAAETRVGNALAPQFFLGTAAPSSGS